MTAPVIIRIGGLPVDQLRAFRAPELTEMAWTVADVSPLRDARQRDLGSVGTEVGNVTQLRIPGMFSVGSTIASTRDQLSTTDVLEPSVDFIDEKSAHALLDAARNRF